MEIPGMSQRLQELALQLRLKREPSGMSVWDPVRRNWFPLTPEETVRQAFLAYLTLDHKALSTQISLEREIRIQGRRRRYDMAIHDRQGKPLALVECKAPSIRIDEKPFFQVARYNLVFDVPYLIITNGATTICLRFDTGLQQFQPLDHIPDFTPK